MKKLLVSAFVIFSFIFGSCCKKEPAVAFKGKETPDLLAQINGKPLYEKDMDSRARTEIFDFKKQLVDNYILQKLIEEFKKAKGYKDNQELFEKEIKNKVKNLSEKDLKAAYAKGKYQQPYDQMKPRIEQQLKGQKMGEVRNDFFAKLKKNTEIVYFFDRPRMTITLNDNDVSRGPKDARVTIVEYTDFQCPYCSQSQATLNSVMSKYSGKVRHVYRSYPLPMHTVAKDAALAAMCAGDQGKFWEYHDILFNSQAELGKMIKQPAPPAKGMPQMPNMKPEIDKANFYKWAGDLKLNADKFKQCLDARTSESILNRDVESAGALGVTSTPAFFINGILISGNRPVSDFTDIIDKELAKK